MKNESQLDQVAEMLPKAGDLVRRDQLLIKLYIFNLWAILFGIQATILNIVPSMRMINPQTPFF